MYVMITKDKVDGEESKLIGRMSFLEKRAEDNASRFDVLAIRKATPDDLAEEITRLQDKIDIDETRLANASWGGGHSSRLNISCNKTTIINLEAAIAGMGEDKLVEKSA